MTVSRVRPSADAWPRTISSPGRGTCGASPRSTPSTSPAWRMCSTSTPSSLDPKRPVVCFDESPTQLIGEARQPIPAAPGRPQRFDYEYRRNGFVNLFVFLERPSLLAHGQGHRSADRRGLRPLHARSELVDFKEAERIRVVLDNLSTPHRRRSPRHLPTGRGAPRAQAAWSSTTRPNTPAGSTRLRSRSACSKANVSTVASKAATSPRCRDRRMAGPTKTKAAPLEATGCSPPDKARTKMARAYPNPSLKESPCRGNWSPAQRF